MEKTEKIRTLALTYCPNCHKEQYVEVEMTPPMVVATLSIEQIKDSRDKVRDEIAKMDISEEDKKQAFEWVNDENNVFGPTEIADIIAGIKNSK